MLRCCVLARHTSLVHTRAFVLNVADEIMFRFSLQGLEREHVVITKSRLRTVQQIACLFCNQTELESERSIVSDAL